MNILSLLGAIAISSISSFGGVNKKESINTSITTRSNNVVDTFKVSFESFSDLASSFTVGVTYQTVNRFIWFDNNYNTHVVNDLTFAQACNYDTGDTVFNLGIYSTLDAYEYQSHRYINYIDLKFVFSLPQHAKKYVSLDLGMNQSSEHLTYITLNGNGFNNYNIYTSYNDDFYGDYNQFIENYSYVVSNTPIKPYRNGYDLPLSFKFSFATAQIDIQERLPLYIEFDFNSELYSEYAMAYHDGYEYGYDDGYDRGITEGSDNGYAAGYQEGYVNGFDDADNMDSTALVIFTGILDIGLLPVNFFLNIFNFEVFGINIGGLVSSLLTVAIVVIVIRVVTGKKSGE